VVGAADPSIVEGTQMKDLLTATEVAEWLGIRRPRVYALMRLAAFPKPISLHGKTIRWRREEVQQWLDSRPRSGDEETQTA
jgi:excisionase family DNA binding protein